MAGASTVEAGMATGIVMAGAVVASASAAGTMRVFEAAVLTTKALGAAASMVVVSFMRAVDSTKAETFMVAEGMEVAMVGTANSRPASATELFGRLAINASRFSF